MHTKEWLVLEDSALDEPSTGHNDYKLTLMTFDLLAYPFKPGKPFMSWPQSEMQRESVNATLQIYTSTYSPLESTKNVCKITNIALSMTRSIKTINETK